MIFQVSHLLKSHFLKGHRLNSPVINYTHANSGAECIQKCMLQDKSCRSVNFLKDDGTNRAKNCEFLRDVSTEKPDLLLPNNSYHYFILLNPNRVSM